MPNSQFRLVNLRGRWIYLNALQKHWPEVLETLMREVLPVYKPTWIKPAERGILEIDFWSHFCLREQNRSVIEKLDYWAGAFSLTDSWIKDAALQTMAERHSPYSVKHSRWEYIPGLDAIGMPPFSPTLNANSWTPEEFGGQEPWEKFRRRMQAEFGKQLTQYHNEASKRVGSGKPDLEREAEWTVRYQKAETAIEIAAVLDIKGYADPEQAVYRKITRFAESIGLTLRKRRRRTGK